MQRIQGSQYFSAARRNILLSDGGSGLPHTRPFRAYEWIVAGSGILCTVSDGRGYVRVAGT